MHSSLHTRSDDSETFFVMELGRVRSNPAREQESLQDTAHDEWDKHASDRYMERILRQPTIPRSPCHEAAEKMEPKAYSLLGQVAGMCHLKQSDNRSMCVIGSFMSPSYPNPGEINVLQDKSTT